MVRNSSIYYVTDRYQHAFHEVSQTLSFVCIHPSGERLVQYATDNLVVEVLIHPQLYTLQQCMRNMLASFTKHRHIIHGGYTFAGSGSWVLNVSHATSLL